MLEVTFSAWYNVFDPVYNPECESDPEDCLYPCNNCDAMDGMVFYPERVDYGIDSYSLWERCWYHQDIKDVVFGALDCDKRWNTFTEPPSWMFEWCDDPPDSLDLWVMIGGSTAGLGNIYVWVYILSNAPSAPVLGEAHPCLHAMFTYYRVCYGALTVEVWSKVDDDTATATLPVGHGLVDDDEVTVWWSGGQRVGVVVAMEGDVATLDGGTGDSYPVGDTYPVYVAKEGVTYDPDPCSKANEFCRDLTDGAVCETNPTDPDYWIGIGCGRTDPDGVGPDAYCVVKRCHVLPP
jgi:hypothetical protein